jgi:hypothetical protein
MYMKHICVFGFLLDGAEHPFQQYISYIVAVSLLVEETRGPGENHRPVVSY